MATQIQLTKVKGSYVQQLRANTTDINLYYNNKTISTQQFKQFIRDIIMGTNEKSLEQKSPATIRFLTSLDQQKTKDGILMLVYNSQLNGDGLGVI